MSPNVAKFGGKLKTTKHRIAMRNGEPVLCRSSCFVQFFISGIPIKLDGLVSQILPEYDMLLGMTAVSAMGAVTIYGNPIILFKWVNA